MDRKKVINYVKIYYENKDIMHDMSHIGRILRMSEKLKKYVPEKIDEELIFYGAYFHGLIKNSKEIEEFLLNNNVDVQYIEKIIHVTKESLKENKAETIEGKILHDAHMIEGGRYFLLIKSFITGSVRGQELIETIKYFKENILECGECYITEAKELLAESRKLSKEAIADLEEYI